MSVVIYVNNFGMVFTQDPTQATLFILLACIYGAIQMTEESLTNPVVISESYLLFRGIFKFFEGKVGFLETFTLNSQNAKHFRKQYRQTRNQARKFQRVDLEDLHMFQEEHTREHLPGGGQVKYDEKHTEKGSGDLHGGETKIEHKEKKEVKDRRCC